MSSSSAVGNYFHKYVGVSEGTLTFTGVNTNPTVGITYSWQYAKSGDAGDQFFWTKN
jgi:hypothetical protein